jgi:uncharacterized protein YbjT (DUF2867 family)
MKIVVIGGSGLVGSQVVTKLGEHGHDAIAASPDSGVNTLTGEGVAEVLEGADVVIDVSNSPSFEDAAVLDFFETSTGNLLAAEKTAGVGHHVALSVVGTERLADKGYFHAKRVQEKLIAESGIPYSIVHATQFFEFIKSIAALATDGDTVRLPPVLFQPIASEDVAKAVGSRWSWSSCRSGSSAPARRSALCSRAATPPGRAARSSASPNASVPASSV